MKGIIVLIIVSISIANTSNVSNDVEVTTTEYDVTSTSSSEESPPKRPVFPKNAQNFFSTTTSTSVRNITTPATRSSKKPVFKIVTKAMKMKNKNYWRTATTRPSLMKFTKYTVNPLASKFQRHFQNSDKQTNYEKFNRRHENHHNHIEKSKNTSDEDDSSEEALDTPTKNEKRKNELKHVKTLIRRFHKLGAKINKEKYIETISKLKKTDKLNKPSDSMFSSEEKQDRKEFIFVTPKKTKEHDVKVAEESDESSETTANILEKVTQPRQKRSINIIEEENLGTTVSGFKFTGKVAALSNDLVFRNINT